MAAKRRTKKAATRSRRRRAAVAPVAAKPRRRRKRAAAVAAAPRRRRRRVKSNFPSGTMMEAKRRRRRKARRVSEAWRGDAPGHRKASKKGWKRRKSTRRRVRRVRETVMEAPRRRRRRARRVRETVMEAPRRRRRAKHRYSYETNEAKRSRRRGRRRSRGLFEARRSGGAGLDAAQFATAALLGGIGFVAADALDRFLATYNPAGDPAKTPKDKFTSSGAGTLANTLNIAATPHLMRIGASVGMVALPAIGSMFVRNPMVRSGLEGFAIGSGVKLFSLFWNNFVVGHLLAPKDADQAALQKSHIARLYPAEVSAAINLKQSPPKYDATGALSGAPDVGPFALAGSSPYPDTAEALRQEAYGISGYGNEGYPSTVEALNRQAFGVGGVWDESLALTNAAAPNLYTAQQVYAAIQAAIAQPSAIFATLQSQLPQLPVQTLQAIDRLVRRHLARLGQQPAAYATQYTQPYQYNQYGQQQQYQYPYGHPWYGRSYYAGQYVHPYAAQYGHAAYAAAYPNHSPYAYAHGYAFRPAAPIASHQVWGRPAAPYGRLHDDPNAPPAAAAAPPPGADPNAPPPGAPPGPPPGDPNAPPAAAAPPPGAPAGDPNAPPAPPPGADPNAPPPPQGHHGHHGHHHRGQHYRNPDGTVGPYTGPAAVPVPAEQIALPPQGYAPGPGSQVGPGPRINRSGKDSDCGCIGEDARYLGLGFVNDDSENSLLSS